MKINFSALFKGFSPLCLLTIVVLVGCETKEKAGTAELIPSFPVVEVVQKDTVLQTDYVADIQAVKNVEVRARVQGFLEKIFVDEGQEVKKGQTIGKVGQTGKVTGPHLHYTLKKNGEYFDPFDFLFMNFQKNW